MSAHPFPQRRGWFAALAAQVSEFVFEEIEDEVAPEQVELKPRPVVVVVSAHPRSGATTVARLLAAELAIRDGGSALVWSAAPPGRGGPAARPGARLAIAMRGVCSVKPCGRLAIAGGPAAALIEAGRFLAPVVLDARPDGSAAEVATLADRRLVVAGADAEPALLEAVAAIIGDDAIKVATRVSESGAWEGRADTLLPDARLAARAAVMGTRALGPLGAAVSEIADALELSR